MPSESDHIALANNNHRAMMCLHDAEDDHSEWVATVAFYKAVHLVQAMLSKAGRSCHDHKTRHDILKSRYPEIWKHYRPLWSASTIARYLHDNDSRTPYKQFSDHCPSDQVYERYIQKRLRAVENHAWNKLSPESQKILIRVPE